MEEMATCCENRQIRGQNFKTSKLQHVEYFLLKLTVVHSPFPLSFLFLPFFLPEAFHYGRKHGSGCPLHTHTHTSIKASPLLGHPSPRKVKHQAWHVAYFVCWWSVATYELKRHPEDDMLDLLFYTVCRTVIPNLAQIGLGLFKTGCLFAFNLATHSEGIEATEHSLEWLWPYVIASTHNES